MYLPTFQKPHKIYLLHQMNQQMHLRIEKNSCVSIVLVDTHCINLKRQEMLSQTSIVLKPLIAHRKCVLYHVEETTGLETCELIFPIDGIFDIHAITCGCFDKKTLKKI